MAISIRSGTVLGGRYLMIDLLSEAHGGKFWRAHDRILSRSVAVHVIPADDERSDLLTAAARQSALVNDSGALRVLDIDVREGWCYVVN